MRNGIIFFLIFRQGVPFCLNIQGVPLATEPGISLIILTPMKILQRNLNRSTFVVWEMKRNVSVVRLIVETRSSGPPASQPVSCLTRLSADLSVIWLRLPTQYGCFFVSVSVCVSSHRIHFKFRCNVLISGKIIQEMPGSVSNGTPCIIQINY